MVGWLVDRSTASFSKLKQAVETLARFVYRINHSMGTVDNRWVAAGTWQKRTSWLGALTSAQK